MTYKLVITETYKKRLKRFLKQHPDMKNRYAKTITLLEVNPYHPSLRLHKLKEKLKEYSSISVSMEYRLVIDFIIKDSEIIPIDIGSHDEVY